MKKKIKELTKEETSKICQSYHGECYSGCPLAYRNDDNIAIFCLYDDGKSILNNLEKALEKEVEAEE